MGLGLGLGLEGEEFVSLGHSFIQMFRAKKVRGGGVNELALMGLIGMGVMFHSKS